MNASKFVGEVVREGKRVRWPKRDTLIPSIIVVVVIAAFFALLLYVEDLAGNKLIDILKTAFASLENASSAVGE